VLRHQLGQDLVLGFVSYALEGEAVGLELIDDRRWRVWFSFYEIGVMGADKLMIRSPEPQKSQPTAGGVQRVRARLASIFWR
jgi:hypothetical protein